MATVIWAMDHGCNWDWFAKIELHNDNTATVLGEGRLHRSSGFQGADIIDRYYNAAGRNHYRIVEPRVAFGEKRIATGVTVNGNTYSFREPIGRWDLPPLPLIEE